MVGAGEFGSGEGVGDGDDGHLGGTGGFDAGGGVFYDAAFLWRNVEEFGGAEENVGGGFAVSYVLDADDDGEVLAEIFEGEDGSDDGMVAAGSEGEFVDEGKAVDELREVFEDGLFRADDFEEAMLFAGGEFFDGVGGFVFGDEVEPEGVVRAAVVCGEIDAMGLAVADLFEDVEEGAFVARLGIDDDAVHIEDDGAEFLVH